MLSAVQQLRYFFGVSLLRLVIVILPTRWRRMRVVTSFLRMTMIAGRYLEMEDFRGAAAVSQVEEELFNQEGEPVSQEEALVKLGGLTIPYRLEDLVDRGRQRTRRRKRNMKNILSTVASHAVKGR
jgi:hypothetical protein